MEPALTPSPSLRCAQPWGFGIFAVDSGYVRPRFDAIHLIVDDGRAAIVDTGTTHSVPRVLDALAELGVPREAVDWVVLTHVHLDHAGGAGALLQHLPNARLTVHPRGARHMIDPARLWAGTVAVYGRDAAEQAYGKIVPVPAERIVETGEGASITLSGRRLDFIDTPGHARHHVVVRDSASSHLFAGDMFGISYRDFDVEGRAFIFPSSTPVQFDPLNTIDSIGRMLALSPEAIYLTHWSQVRDIPRLGRQLIRLTQAYARVATDARDAVMRDLPKLHSMQTRDSFPFEAPEARAALEAKIGDALKRLYLEELRAHGTGLDDAAISSLLAMDIELNAAGLVDWLAGAETQRLM